MAKAKRSWSGLATWLAAGALIAAGGGIAWYSTAGGASQGRPALHEMETLAASSAPAEIVVPAPAAAPSRIELGGLPTRVVVSAAGIDTAIDEVGVFATDRGLQWETVWAAAGHHIDSALPGEPGNVVSRATFPSPTPRTSPSFQASTSSRLVISLRSSPERRATATR